MHIKLRCIKFTAFGISIFPDKKYFVNSIGSIYFQFVIAITAINKNFQITF